jgi:hypothetical protein
MLPVRWGVGIKASLRAITFIDRSEETLRSHHLSLSAVNGILAIVTNRSWAKYTALPSLIRRILSEPS